MKKLIVLITAFGFAAVAAMAQDPYQTSPKDKTPVTTQPGPATIPAQPATPATPAQPQTQPATPATPAQPATPNRQATNVQKQQKDGIVFRDGKLWNMKAGKGTAVDKEITLSNGTKVKSDGSVVMKDGTQTTLSEGDYISMDGKLERAKPNRMTEKNDMDNNKDYKDQE
jgi:hypothetical protein